MHLKTESTVGELAFRAGTFLALKGADINLSAFDTMVNHLVSLLHIALGISPIIVNR